MNKYPDEIWAYAGSFKMWRKDFPSHAKASQPTKYIRKDVSDALVAAAREKALREAAQVAQDKHDLAMEWASTHVKDFDGKTDSLLIAEEILALIEKDKSDG